MKYFCSTISSMCTVVLFHSCSLTFCRVYCPPGGSKAHVYHLVIGREAEVKEVSVANQVLRAIRAAM